MNSKHRIKVGVSSALVDLKAELLRKQTELQESKSRQKGVQKSVSKSNELLEKRLALKRQKNAGVEKRNAADLEEHERNEKTYDRAKTILEAKAKLYDQMTTEALHHEVYDHPVLTNSLVNFQQKAMDNYSESKKVKKSVDPNLVSGASSTTATFNVDEDDWVEFIDTLGRTRRCHKSKLAEAMAVDEELAREDEKKSRPEASMSSGQRFTGASGGGERMEASNNNINLRSSTEIGSGNKIGGDGSVFGESVSGVDSPSGNVKSGNYSAVPPATMLNLSKTLTEEQVTEMKQRKWEKESEAAAAKDDIHYQDVLFDEVRSHGVGYFAFSKEDEQRAEQIRDLKKLTEQTKATREKVMKERSQKSSQLKTRLRKIVNKKRAKLGLPPKESSSEDEDEVEGTKKLGDKQDDNEEKRSDGEEDAEAAAKKEKILRAWDFGKPGVYGPKPVNFDELDYKWLKDRREDRVNEFAPPTTYYTQNKNYGQASSSAAAAASSSTSFSSSNGRGNKYGNFVKAMETTILNQQKLHSVQKPPPPPPPPPMSTNRKATQQQQPVQHDESKLDDGDCSSSHFRSWPQKPVPIHNEELPTSIPDSVDYKKRGQQGVEIPPPPTFSYFQGDVRQPTCKIVPSKDEKMADSIEAGIRALRQQFDKKQQQPPSPPPPPPGCT